MRLLIPVMLLAAMTTGFAAAGPDYFPLLEGNQWIYMQRGIGAGGPFVVEVGRPEKIGGRVWFPVRGLPGGDLWLRSDGDGNLLLLDRETGAEKVWVAFGAPEGSVFETAVTECNETARIESRNTHFSGPVGEFPWALQVDYLPGPCADAGVLREFYLPYVGLLEQTVSTIAGPRTRELIYARLAGVTFVSEPTISFTLALDHAVYKPDPKSRVPAAPVLRARMTLRNHFLPLVQFTFPSGQKFDLVLRNESGEIVYRWSEGKAFTEALVMEQLGHGEKNYVIEVPLVDHGGLALPAGEYQAEAWLTNIEGGRFAATAGFRIAESP